MTTRFALPFVRVATSALALCALVLVAAPVAAQDEPESEPADADPSPVTSRAHAGIGIGGKVGAGIGKPASDFGATPIFELELSYLLPLDEPIGRSLGLFLGVQYVQPGMDEHVSAADERLPGDGQWSYELTQQELTFSLGGIYRFDLDSKLIMPYGGIGGRMYLLRTQIKGDAASEAFGENEETKTGFGLLLLGGVEFYLGPGALLGELQFGWGPLDAYVLRDTNLGALSLSVGYRLFI